MLLEEIKIEKNLPIPESRGRNVKYPFGKMEIGDSFFLEENTPRLHSAASHFGKRNDKKFSIRKEGKGKRCWRIA